MMDEYRRVLGVLTANPRIYSPDEVASRDSEEEKPAVSEPLTSLDITEWRTIYGDLHGLLETFEADAVEDYVQKLRNRSYQGKPLPELLAPMMEKVSDFEFTAALDELDAIGGAR